MRAQQSVHGRIPCTMLDLEHGLKPQATTSPNNDLPEEVLLQTQQSLKQNPTITDPVIRLPQTPLRKKASANTLVVNYYC